MASSAQAGELLALKAPAAGQTTEIEIMLLDSSGDPVTGEAFDAAGMTIEYCKHGDAGFTAFPSFATGNWDEKGYGNYDIILSGDAADETALLDTEGHMRFYVKTDATRGDTFLRKVNVRDVNRQTDMQLRVQAAL